MGDLNTNNLNNDWWDETPELLRLHINKGVNDAETGRTLSSKEFWEILKSTDDINQIDK